jgi:hypothetical protein
MEFVENLVLQNSQFQTALVCLFSLNFKAVSLNWSVPDLFFLPFLLPLSLSCCFCLLRVVSLSLGDS